MIEKIAQSLPIEKSFGNRFSNFISYVFHPVYMPLIGVFILLNSNLYISYTISPQAKNIIYIVFFINTILAPILSVLFLKRKNWITDITLNRKTDRLLSISINLGLVLFTLYLFKSLQLPKILNSYVLGIALSCTVPLVFSWFLNISLHTTGVGGLLGLLYAIISINHIFIPLLFFTTIGIAAIIAMARLQLNAHTSTEVYSGFISGFITIFFAINVG